MNENDYIMWLLSSDKIGIQRALAIIGALGSAENAFKAKRSELLIIGGIGEIAVDALIASRSRYDFEAQMRKLEKNGAKFVSIFEEYYPESLRQTPLPPIGLYYIGTLPREQRLISIIGTRKATDYGVRVTKAFTPELVNSGLGIVSGMARGTDSNAHEATLEANGYTIAVLGSGIDVCYPPENHKLFERIKQTGCVMTEYPFGEKPNKQNFPARNRIIAGLGEALIVIEAEERSGTSFTVEYALELGREVFAVPGNITSGTSKGTNKLILDGATPALSAAQILEHLRIGLFDARSEIDTEERQEARIKELDEQSRLVYEFLQKGARSADTLAEETSLSIQNINFILTKLEIQMYIKRSAGQRYEII